MQQTNDILARDNLFANATIIIEKGRKLIPNEKKLLNLSLTLNQIEDSSHNVFPVSPQVLSDISLTYPGVRPNSIAILGSTLYLTATSSKSIFSINNSSKSTGVKIVSKLISEPVAATITDQGYIIVYDKNNGLLQIDKNGNINQIPGLSDIKNISAVGSYNKNLYFLDAIDQIIYRSVAVGTGYSVASSYINDKILQNTTSLSVDGNVFVASPISGLTRYYGGKRTPLGIGNSPLLGKPLGPITFVYTSMYLENIYLLDPQNKRIIALSKPKGIDTITYSFIKQYLYRGKQNFFSDLSGFSIDMAEKNMYVLDGSKVLKISL